MKYCPTCNFSFPDFQHVCDFDRTELVSDPERKALIKAPRSLLRRFFAAPTFLTSLAILVLVLGKVLISFFYSDIESIPAVKYQDSARPNSILTADRGASDQFAQINLPARSTRSSVGTLRLAKTPSRSVARLNQRTSARDRFEFKPQADISFGARVPRQIAYARGNASEPLADRNSQVVSPRGAVVTTGSQKSEIAARKETRPKTQTAPVQTARNDVSSQKTPKVTAFLKATWRVLKKPFDF